MTESPPYLDPSLNVSERVEDLLNRMTLEEKVGQMCQYLLPESTHTSETDSSPEVGDDATMRYSESDRDAVPTLIARGLIGSILSVTDPAQVNAAQRLAAHSRLGIPLLFGIDAIHGNAMHPGATVFPAPIGLAATWDLELTREVAKTTARETRACNLHWTFSPNVDVLRDGRWGRSGETFGEDPLLVGAMGVAMIEGYQDKDDPDAYVMACAKHFIAGGEPPNGLNFAAMDLSERALREVFLPPFADAVAAGVDTFMAAHNEVNGIPCHGNRYLLTDILRGELGFSGFVVSDFTDVARLFTLHRVATSLEDADRQAVEAGIDMHMHGPGFLEPIVSLVECGDMAPDRIDEAVRLILTAKFKLGLFEHRYVDTDAVAAQLATPEHQALALKAARKSLVLLKNDPPAAGEAPLLPLNRALTRLFVTGPNVDNQSILGDWVVAQPSENIVTVLQGLRAGVSAGTFVDYLDCGDVLSITDEAIADARAQAAVADVAVVVIGENPLRYSDEKTEGENVPRADLDLPGRQQALVDAVLASGTPTVVVLINGRPLSVSRIAEAANALLEAFHPGMHGGQAIADALFGTINPGGRLPYTVPRTVGQVRAIYNHRPADYFRQYRLTPHTPLFPFGHGLSYTTFVYSELSVPEVVSAGNDVPVTLTLTNTGDRQGDEVIIVYLHDHTASVTRPVKEVAAFCRVTLTPGETQTLTLPIPGPRLALYDRQMQRVIEPGIFEVTVVDKVARFEVIEALPSD